MSAAHLIASSGTAGSGASIDPDESLLRAVILASAQPLSGSGGIWSATSGNTYLPFVTSFYRYPIPSSLNVPDMFAGFGMPILDNAVTMAGSANNYKMFYTSETTMSATPDSAFTISCNSQLSLPVTIVLAWTDPPGFTL